MMPALNTLLLECPWCPMVLRTAGNMVRHKKAKHLDKFTAVQASAVAPVAESVASAITPCATPDWSRVLCPHCRVPRQNRSYCAHCLIALFAAPRMERQAA